MIEMDNPEQTFKIRFTYQESPKSPIITKEEILTKEEYEQLVIKTEVTPCPKYQTQD